MPPLLSVSLFERAACADPVLHEVDWPNGFDDFTEADARIPDGTKHPGKDGLLWSPALFEGRRALANVVTVCALVLDYDHADLSAAEVMQRWAGYEHVLHSTYTPGRYRVILPYPAPITPAEHVAVFAWVQQREGTRIDGGCKDASRMFYWPTARTDLDTPPVFGYNQGERLDVARLPVDLRAVPASRSTSSESKAPPTVLSKAAQVHGARQDTPGGVADPYRTLDEAQQRESLPLIESRCAFMRHVRADAATLSQPEWYAALSIVSRCVGGDDLAHEISRPYAGYSYDETESVYQRAKTSAGPRTCRDIRALTGPSGACAGCPLQVTSPVLLGRTDSSGERVVQARTPVDVTENAGASPAPPPDEPDLQAAITDAEARLETARRAEDNAIVASEAARRRVQVLRSAGTVASEEEMAAAVLAHHTARRDVKARERARTYAERDLAGARSRTSVEGLPAGADPAVWQRLRIVRDREGRAHPQDTLGNILTVLDTDPRWSSRISYDSFSQDVCLDGEALSEEYATLLTTKLEYDYQLITATARVMECLRVVAKKRKFHPVVDWLNGLTWDGTPRVDDLLLTGFGAHPGNDEALVREVGRKFIVSLVARVFKPGEKVDTMLILTGKQGMFKSTSFETLVGTKWFLSTKLDLNNKDSYIQLRGKWLVEFGELAAIKGAGANTQKGWRSQKVDNYRAPFAKRAEDHPRQTVGCGTTNDDEFIADPTGYRRDWPFRVGKANLRWIEQNRAQLFAEAVALYKAGTTWWFDEETEEAERMRRWAAPYQTSHPWLEVVVAWLNQTANVPVREFFTTIDVLHHGVGLDVKDIKQAEFTAVGNILRQLNCEKVPGRIVQAGVNTTRYRRPAGWASGAASENKIVPMRA